MKQFTRCTNCRQWYVQTSTTSVEIVQGQQGRRLTVWCARCIDDAERRSQSLAGSQLDTPARVSTSTALQVQVGFQEEGQPACFQHLLQEHTELMERALHEEEPILLPLIHDFLQRCRTCQEQLHTPTDIQRLAGHIQYWGTFLRILNPSG